MDLYEVQLEADGLQVCYIRSSRLQGHRDTCPRTALPHKSVCELISV